MAPASFRVTPGKGYNGIRFIPVTMADSEIIFSVQESAEGGYEAHALGHSIHTQADSMDELRNMLKDAVRCHFEPESMPRVIRLHMVKDEVIPV